MMIDIDKAVEWLKENYRDFWGYVEFDYDPTEMFDLFRKAMAVKESLTIAELTWEDCKKIVEIADGMVQTAHDRVEWEDKSEQAYYEEVLRKFKED